MLLLMVGTTVVLVPEEYNVKASGGGGGDEENNVGINMSYVEDITTALSEIITDSNIYPEGTLAKGRAFGSAGEHYAAEGILQDEMIALGLYDPCLDPPHLETIKNRSGDALKKITFSKGGVSFLAMMCLFSIKLKNKQRKTIYEFGAALQLMDDYYDCEKDFQSGIKTIPNQKMLKFVEIREIFFCAVNNLIAETNINPDHPNALLEILCRASDEIHKKSLKE